MLKKAALFLGLALTLKANAFAWVGGPFSNGGFNSLLERNGVYHATFNFKNGSGYAYFTPENSATPVGNNTANFDSPGSIRNRSVIYYKGLVFVGMASGTSDIDKRKISGITNGYSEYKNAAATGNQNAGNSGVSSATSIVTNAGGAGYTANVNFSAKIKQTHPQIRFRGKGELAVISPNAFSQASELIADYMEENMSNLTSQMSEAYQRVLDAIVTTSFPTSKFIVLTSTEIIPAVVDGEGNVIQPQGFATKQELQAVLGDPFTEAQLQQGLNLMNLMAGNNLDLNNRVTESSLAALYDALNPPSNSEIAEKYTEFVDIRVTGVLRSL